MLAVLITCFNRKQLTLRAIAALKDAADGKVTYRVILVDDGSSDGTSQAVAAAHPEVTIVQGDGTLFWNGGMRLAWQTSLEHQDDDFFLWLNDDTELMPGAISQLVETYRAARKPQTIVVGHTVDPDTHEITYGGYIKQERAISQLRYRRAGPSERYCDTMNGNCVLIPRSAVSDVGINDPHYTHSFGDNDYGLRARQAGYDIIQMATPVATQKRNSTQDRKNQELTLSTWKAVLFSPKGIPVSEWLYFCRRHGGVLWPVNFLFRYLKMAANGVRNRQ